MGGSVRIPAAWCGLVGLKPSFGRIPLDFLPTQFDTIQHFGPLARTVDDARLFLSVAQGPSERDVMSLAPPLDLGGPIDGSVDGMRLGLDVDLGCYDVAPEVERAVRESADALAGAGAVVEEVDVGWGREVADAFKVSRLPSRADRSRMFLGHVVTVMPANPLAPKTTILPSGSRPTALTQVYPTEPGMLV